MTDRRLSGIASMLAADRTPLRVLKDEKHTEFVKRIVNAYLDAAEELAEEMPRPLPKPMKSGD